MISNLLQAMKVISFFFAFYITFQFICKLYVSYIKQIGDIHISQRYRIYIGRSYVIGIPLLWSFFYFLYTIKVM